MLDPEVAADFLVNRTGDPDRQAACELAGELGGLPLALEQAAAYVQATGNNQPGRVPAAVPGPQGGPAGPRRSCGHPANVAATLGLALSRLADEAPATRGWCGCWRSWRRRRANA